MLTKKADYLLIVFIAMLFLTGLCHKPVLALAQEVVEEPVAAEEAPAMNAAQRAKAHNLALASIEPEEIEGLPEAIDAVREAEEAITNAPDDITEEEMEALEKALKEAQDNANSIFSEAVGVKADEIAAMKADGMGWGVIAWELGVHPSVLGLGHKKIYAETLPTSVGAQSGQTIRTKQQKTTKRSLKGGLALGHGVLSDGKPNSSKGLGAEKAKAGKESAPGQTKDKSDKSKGKGSEKSKGGGKGKGSGKNK